MDQHRMKPCPLNFPSNRREFLARSGMGLGALGLATLVDGRTPMAPRNPLFAP